MKTKKAYLVIVILLLGSLVGNRVCAQYAPGEVLPDLKTQPENFYDFRHGQKGFVRWVGVGRDTPMEQRCYSIVAGDPQGESFRVCANGTVALFVPRTFTWDAIPSAALNFYSNDGSHRYLGGINCDNNKMTISGYKGISFWGIAKNTGTPHFSIKSNGSVSVSEAITMKIGRNGAPTIKGETADKWLRIGGANGIALWGNKNMDDEDSPHVLIKDNEMTIGQVANPSFALNVGGAIYAEADGIKTYFGKDTDHDDAWIGTNSKHGLYLGTNGNSCLYFDTEDHTYIGLIDTFVAQIRQELKNKYNLFVAKGILSEDYGIGPKSTWSDFVFNKNYTLKTIPEVEEFISENNHLPDVPSAKQVAEEGYSQHDMNKILLQKIEELTLYTIQQQKEIQELKTELNNLKK